MEFSEIRLTASIPPLGRMLLEVYGQLRERARALLVGKESGLGGPALRVDFSGV